MRKNNNPGRNNNMKHRGGGGGGGRRFQSGGNRGGNDSNNLSRQKHHATQMREKFSNMARDAQINGDRVDVEYFQQHVEHYSRVLADIAAIEAERHAHQREHVASIQESSGNTGSDGQDGDASSSGNDSEGDNQSQQKPAPRQRQNRRPHHSAGSDNGADEANSNTDEIPLPGSIISQV